MKRLVDRIFARYGQTALLGGKRVKLFFWSTNSVGWQNMDRMFRPLGEIPRGQYALILPADVAADAGDTVEVADRQYILRRVEKMCLRSGAVYQWGLCVEKGSEDTWGMNG